MVLFRFLIGVMRLLAMDPKSKSSGASMKLESRTFGGREAWSTGFEFGRVWSAPFPLRRALLAAASVFLGDGGLHERKRRLF